MGHQPVQASGIFKMKRNPDIANTGSVKKKGLGTFSVKKTESYYV